MAPLEGKAFCWAHDPENVREREAARKKGGRNRQTPKSGGGGGEGDRPQYRSVEAIQALLERTIADTLLQENSDKRSRTLAALAKVQLETIDAGDFEERLAALEAQQRRSA